MHNTLARWRSAAVGFGLGLLSLCHPGKAEAVTTVFFDSSQTTNIVGSATTSDTILTEGYLFTLGRDKLFTGGVGLTNPIGRSLRITWPTGLEAQAVTTGPTLSGARIVLKRQDGQPFAIQSFAAELLANTAGAGGSFEIMPQLNGEDAVANPYMYNAIGIAGMTFSNTTPEFAGFDAYIITLYVDFALTSLTVVDATPPPPLIDVLPMGGNWLQLSWPTNATGYTLMSASSLPALSWSAVTNSLATNIDLVTVEVEAVGSAQFFRLQK